MSNKRKSSSADQFEPANQKRHCSPSIEPDDEAPSKVPQPRVDPTYGQRGAFPGLDDSPSDDDLFYGPASDGLEYLRMVRSEARTVPNLLVAKSSVAQEPANTNSDSHQGYYADGAYTAAPDPALDGSNGYDDEDEEDAQEAYYTAFRARFRSFSSLLEHSPPSRLISSSASHTAQQLSSGMKRVWREAFDTTPTTIVLGQLPQESVLQGLQILESSLASGDIATKKFLGLWAWGLLARCREAGQMGSEEIGILRDLGKRAVWLLRGMRAGMDYLAREQGQGSDTGSDNGEEEAARDSLDRDQAHQGHETTSSIPPTDSTPAHSDGVQIADSTHPPEYPHPAASDDPLAAAKASLLSSLTPEPPSSSATQPPASDEALTLYATLDMIITIIGEFYGQRDLLEGRLVWGEIF
ncbi:MAG: hypothetical protein Q9195_008524 [Heterodermia aff. obscurata]